MTCGRTLNRFHGPYQASALSNCCQTFASCTHAVEYIIGIVLALVISFSAKLADFDRDGAFYPMLLAVIAALYVLFAAVSGSVHALIVESLVMTVFLSLALIGFKLNLCGSLRAWLGMASLILFTPT